LLQIIIGGIANSEMNFIEMLMTNRQWFFLFWPFFQCIPEGSF
jgi:hypothetical protein